VTVLTQNDGLILLAGHQTIGSRVRECDKMVLEQQIPGVILIRDRLSPQVSIHLFVSNMEAPPGVVGVQSIR
jgi:hypothetical protein